MSLMKIEDAIEEIKAGRMVILVDDEDRENEGDLVIAAEKTTPAAINFMAKHGRGLICLAMTPERIEGIKVGEVEDVEAAPAGKAASAKAEAPAEKKYVLASPAAKRLAKELGVDLASVPGTGKEGRVTEDDVKKFHEEGPDTDAIVMLQFAGQGLKFVASEMWGKMTFDPPRDVGAGDRMPGTEQPQPGEAQEERLPAQQVDVRRVDAGGVNRQLEGNN